MSAVLYFVKVSSTHPSLPLPLRRPIGYLKHLEGLVANYSSAGRDPASGFAVLMDSDTIWSVTDVDVLWRKFDIVRGDRQVVVSTEMNCWVSSRGGRLDWLYLQQ